MREGCERNVAGSAQAWTLGWDRTARARCSGVKQASLLQGWCHLPEVSFDCKLYSKGIFYSKMTSSQFCTLFPPLYFVL